MLDDLPDSLVLKILDYLGPHDVARAGQTCSKIRRVAHDEILWRNLFHRFFKVQSSFKEPIGSNSWRQEFIRLIDEVPIVEAEVLTKHTDQVLHVSFSHDGKRFATTAKDGYVHVWKAKHPVGEPEYSKNMKSFSWKYTQFSQFNESDSLLLVSGVLFGLNSTSGEIAIFSMRDGFALQCRTMSKPYDVFGSWYSEMFFLSGNLHWLGNMVSKSVIWLNKASQEIESEHKAVMNEMFRFYNPKTSSVRSLMVANCVTVADDVPSTSNLVRSSHAKTDCVDPTNEPRIGNPPSYLPLERDLIRINSRGVRGTLQGAFQNWKPLDNVADIDYTAEYHSSTQRERETNQRSPVKRRSRSVDDLLDVEHEELQQSCSSHQLLEHDMHSEHPDATYLLNSSSSNGVAKKIKTDSLSPSPEVGESPKDSFPSSYNSSPAPSCSTDGTSLTDDVMDPREKWLIFTCGSQTYIPHQIGFKKIQPTQFKGWIDPGPPLKERLEEQKRKQQQQETEQIPIDYSNYDRVADRFDKVDCVLDLHGHIIGMALSPDHRYLYVNSRPWPGGYEISNPLEPPPIAQEIDIHVIDLATLRQVGMMRRGHRAYTPNEDCFFIFLDACDLYLASGAEDKHGYLWDRHYGISLTKLPHKDVVNCVAFNPRKSDMLISVSDDNTIKVWRSKHRCRQLKLNPSELNQGTKLYTKRRSVV